MKISSNTNNELNKNLQSLLTMINQYFLHARMLEDWGLKQLGEQNYQYSICVMKNADSIIKRILFLEGLPNLQALGQLYIGENALETNGNNLRMELEFCILLKQSIKIFEQSKDYISRDLLTQILVKNEEHIDYFETQAHLLNELGEQNYLQSLI